MRAFCVFVFTLVLFGTLRPFALHAEVPLPPLPPVSHRVQGAKTAAIEQAPAAAAPVKPSGLLAAVTLADIGFVNGVRFANLGGHRDLFVPLPQDGDVAASELVLDLDDVSAYEARRNLEVQVNDRTVSAIVLDGKTQGRVVRVPLGRTKPKDGYLKLTFIYSGAATLDRCIDVRYVGDSLTIRPETAVEIDLGPVAQLDVATTAALMPRDVAIVLPPRRVEASEMATALTVARSLISSGRHVSFYHGYNEVPGLATPDEAGRWSRGIVLIGPLADSVSVIDPPISKVAGAVAPLGTLAAVRIAGQPALLVSDGEAVRAGRLFASPLLAATRGIASATVGEASLLESATDRITFEQLAVAPAQAEVFGRADLVAVLDTRRLPPGARPTRLLLDVMVAPDGAGEKAVVSVFINERLLGSTVAATGEPTHLDLLLPDGLVGAIANVRALVQRDSAQGDCRFEPQGYPAQILGSSSLVLEKADGSAQNFSDLTSQFDRGLQLRLPPAAADQPGLVLGLVSEVASQLSADLAPVSVNFAAAGSAVAPDTPFIAVSDTPPPGTAPRVSFDRGRVAVTDRSGRTLLDLGGFTSGAVAQIVSAGDIPGLWIKPLSLDGSLPAPPELHLDHGDVAFIDGNGVALAMSTERDTVVRVSYPDHVSWLTVAERFRSWIIAGLWLLATAALLLTLQRMFRRRPANSSD
jgi:cellulose synthase operon protein B